MQKITYSSLNSLGETFHQSFDEALARVNERLGETHSMFIGGKARPASSGATFADISPINSRLELGHFPQGNEQDAQIAIEAARAAHKSWKKVPWQERVALLRRAAKAITKRQYDLAAMLTLEIGKSRAEAIAEVTEASELILYYCKQMEKNDGYEVTMSEAENELTRSVLKSYGVWAVISPFNFPLALSAGMATGALLGGNTVVFKPSSEAPFTGLLLYGAFEEAGLPEGVFNFVTGPGYSVGEEFLRNDGIDGFAFTGSRSVGMQIMNRFGTTVPKPCVIEMGGKNPVIVMPSASLDDAAEGIMRSAFGMGGQKCSATSRAYVHRDIYKQFVDLLVEKTSQLAIGDPIDVPEVFMGPLINPLAAKRFDRMIRTVKQEGRVVYGGGRMRRGPLGRGFFVRPAIVDKLPADSRILLDELFLPILPLKQFSNMDEAIAQCNDTPYGLTAGIFTQDEAEKQRFLNEIEAGVLYCNRRTGATTGAWPGMQSFGGWKSSGTTGKSALGPYYVSQFMREQSQTIVK